MRCGVKAEDILIVSGCGTKYSYQNQLEINKQTRSWLKMWQMRQYCTLACPPVPISISWCTVLHRPQILLALTSLYKYMLPLNVTLIVIVNTVPQSEN